MHAIMRRKRDGGSKERVWKMKMANTNNNEISSRMQGVSRRNRAIAAL